MKVKSKTRKWLLHYARLGRDYHNFAMDWPIAEDGASAVKSFITYESTGKKLPTRSPNTIKSMLAGKKINGINVDMWARDRAAAMLSLAEIKEMCNEVPGLLEEVESLKVEYWPI
tara:strand:- start:412 stop:756 length:345 start_codon:yes stop_codon:yes gene_type:complete